MIFPSEIWG